MHLSYHFEYHSPVCPINERHIYGGEGPRLLLSEKSRSSRGPCTSPLPTSSPCCVFCRHWLGSSCTTFRSSPTTARKNIGGRAEHEVTATTSPRASHFVLTAPMLFLAPPPARRTQPRWHHQHPSTFSLLSLFSHPGVTLRCSRLQATGRRFQKYTRFPPGAIIALTPVLGRSNAGRHALQYITRPTRDIGAQGLRLRSSCTS
ncbi:hypothetical protein FKP32DRAFT_92029 [Trametes sanguinea]|nr:hypothetical protein FKP32DRAFT_92029 [Trametes sanguinea]